MSEEQPNEEKPKPTISVETTTADDGRSVALTFRADGAAAWSITADSSAIDEIVHALASARGQMSGPVPVDLPDGTHPLADYDPRWYVLPDTTNKFATLWLRHPGLGWSGFGLPRHEAGSIARHLIRTPAITTPDEKRASLPKEASSFGGDDFLIATSGLGFYYYGVGDGRIGPNPFEQVEYDSDRSAGIVAGSIAEQRLERALKSVMKKENEKASEFLFQPSGPLGPFRTKIDLAHLLGLLSDDAYKDLTNLKNIRNDFAHRLELDTFDKLTIKDRCANFILVDRHIGPRPEIPIDGSPQIPGDRPNPYLGLADHQARLADPRFRYVMTAQLLGYALGVAADSPSHALPFV
jgi:hypothetical protein